MEILAQKIAKIEGKKSQARIGDIKEIIKILITLMAEEVIESGEAETSFEYGSIAQYLMETAAKIKAKQGLQ